MPYGKRSNPVKNREERMTRADSLASVSEFGSVVPKSKQEAMRKKKPMGPLARLKNALSGGKGK